MRIIALAHLIHRSPVQTHCIPHRVSNFPRGAWAIRRYASSVALPLKVRSEAPGKTTPGEGATTSKEGDMTPEELEERTTNDLTASFMELMDLVKAADKQTQSDLIRDKFQAPELQIPSQARIAENVIRFLFERRSFDQAMRVYQHMLQAGYIPSPSTDALMLAVTLKASTAPGDDQLEGFKTILGYKSFTETHFLELLEHISHLDVPPDTAVILTHLFISVKGEDFRPSRALLLKLIDLQTRAGHYMEAAGTIDGYDLPRSTFDIWAEPYARVISSAPSSDQEAVDYIMGAMMDKGIPVHPIVFNALIFRERMNKQVRKGFAIHVVLMRLAETTPLRPDATTYTHLFSLLGFTFKNDYKPNFSRRWEDIGAVTPPRQLFSEMMAQWFNTTSHPPASVEHSQRQSQIKADQKLVTTVFRSFLYNDDIPGAMVVLATILDLGLVIDGRMYYALLRYMSRKVYYDVYVSRMQHRNAEAATALIGNFSLDTVPMRAADAYPWIIEQLLERSQNGRQKLSGARIPTVDEIMSQEDDPRSGEDLDSVPLYNLLWRALQAQPIVLGTGVLPWGVQWINKAVRKARFHMMPRRLKRWTWKPEILPEKEKNTTEP